jgi:hypothetical protein
MAGNNGYGRGHGLKFETKTAADVQREQEEHERRLRGTDDLRRALRTPGSILFLSCAATVVQDRKGASRKASYLDVLGPCGSPKPDHPVALREGAMLLYVGIERIEVDEGGLAVRKPYYTFLMMGLGKRVAVRDVSILRTTRA